jgi:hypothetical protein
MFKKFQFSNDIFNKEKKDLPNNNLPARLCQGLSPLCLPKKDLLNNNLLNNNLLNNNLLNNNLLNNNKKRKPIKI